MAHGLGSLAPDLWTLVLGRDCRAAIGRNHVNVLLCAAEFKSVSVSGGFFFSFTAPLSRSLVA